MSIRRAVRDVMSAALIATAVFGGTTSDSAAQAAPRKQEAPDKDAAVSASRFTAGLVAGSPQTTEFAVAQDIATTLAANQESGPRGEVALRVLPMVGNGGQRNVLDVLTLAGADMAIVPVVLADRLRDARTYGDIRSKLTYIAPLFPQEFHLLVRGDIGSVADLAGKKISLGEEGSPSAVLGLEIVNSFDVKADTVNMGLESSLEALRRGEIVGMMLVSAKPIEAVARFAQFNSLRFVSIPYTSALQRDYRQATIGHDDYPSLLGLDETVQTISVGSALFAYNWPKRSARRDLMELFVQNFFSRFPEFLRDGHPAAWRQVDLAGTVAGWKRFETADRWIAKHAKDGTVLSGAAGPPPTKSREDGLLREYLRRTPDPPLAPPPERKPDDEKQP